MRHHDHHGPTGAQGGDGGGQAGLARRIQIGIGLVQNDKAGLATQRARQTDALDLTARQIGPLTQTTDLRGIAVGQAQDHVMHPGHGGGGDHGGIGHFGVKAGDIVAQGTGQQINLLRQIADMAAQNRRVPLVTGGTVQPDFAAVPAPGPGQQPRQCRFARGRGTDHPHGIAGDQIKADVVQQAAAVGGGNPGTFAIGGVFDQMADADLSGRGGQVHGDNRHRRGGKECHQAAVRFHRLADAAPLRNHLIDRPQRPSGQDRRGDDHAARHLALNDKIGPQGQDGRLHQHAKGPAGGADIIARRTGLLTGGKGSVLQAAPLVADLLDHAHGRNHLGVALAALGKVAGNGIVGQAADHRAMGKPVAKPGQPGHDDRPGNGQPAQPRMHHEQHRQIQGHPRQIENPRHRRARQKAAQAVQIAQGLALAQILAAAQPAAKGCRPKAAVQLQRQP